MDFTTAANPNVITSTRALLDPIGTDAFIDRHLEREVLHLERGEASLVEGIFDLESMGRCLHYMKPQLRECLRVVAADGEGERTTEYGSAARNEPDDGVARLKRAFADRHTLIFTGAEAYWPPVERIVMDLRRSLHSMVRCNVYCTPPASQGFDTHVDGHDVLVLQTSGTKTWRIHETGEALPMESSPVLAQMLPRLASAVPDHGEPSREVVLHPGDVLYLPRGVPHSAASTDQHSVHLTIGLYPMRMHEFIGQVVDLVAFEVEELRRRAPIEFHSDDHPAIPTAGDLLRRVAEFADGIDPPIDLRRLLQTNEESHAPPGDPASKFASALAGRTIDLDTVVERPGGTVWRTRRTPEEFRVSCGGTMSLPLKLEPVLGFLEAHPCFRVGDLPRILTDSAKITLVRNLLANDLLQPGDGPAPRLDGTGNGMTAPPSNPDLPWLKTTPPGIGRGS